MQYTAKLYFKANGLAIAPGTALSADHVKTIGKGLPKLVADGVIVAVKPAVAPKDKDQKPDEKKA